MKPQKISTTPAPLLVLVVLFLWLAASAWFRPLMHPDEGRYVGVAFEMLRSGDWLVPRLDGMPFFHKPPLFYWISAAGMSVFGAHELPARLPSLLGATAAAYGLWAFLRRWADSTTAHVSTVALVTMPFFYLGAQFANLDMLVAGCITSTILLAAHAALAKDAGLAWRLPLAGTFLAAALGVLAKGLIGFLLPGAIFLLWCAATRRWQSARLLLWPAGWLLFLALAAPWFVKMQLLYPGFFDYFVVTQHFRRFAGSGFNNRQAFWFYPPVILALALPWTGWIAAALGRQRAQFNQPSPIAWLMLVWMLLIVAFFSVPTSKLIGYVLPALPPLAWCVARCVAFATQGRERQSSWLRACAGLAAALCVVATVAVGLLSVPTGVRLPRPPELAPGDRVVMLGRYEYDLPFYWRLAQPMQVVADWNPATVVLHDNWQKELFDSGQFEPAAAQQQLLDPARLPGLVCQPGTTWLVGLPDADTSYPWLADQRVTLVYSDARAKVWKVSTSPGAVQNCPATAG